MLTRRKFLQASAAAGVAAPFIGKAHAATKTLKLSTVFPKGHYSADDMAAFAAKVEEATGGEIKVRLFAASELGDYTTVYEEVRRGSIDMALQNVPSQFDPRVEIATLNYAVMNIDEASKLMGPSGFITRKMAEFNGAVGVKMLGGSYALGFGGLGLMKQPTDLYKPGAPKNLLLRVPPYDTFQAAMGSVGFQTVTVPYADLFSALQTGVADGWAGGGAEVNYSAFSDVIKFYVPINNYFETYNFLMNAEAFAGLSADHQALFEKLASEITDNSLAQADKIEKDHQKKLADKGIEVVPFGDEHLKAWAEHVRTNSWAASEAKIGADLIAELKKQY